jgi:alpha-beta hydrolase superfamily lysophospholipase
MEIKRRRLGLILLVVFLCVISCRPIVIHISEKKFLVTGPNGPETPASLGIPFERLKIASGRRQLDSFLVRAPSTYRMETAVLVFHGVGETISQWVKAQRFLYDHCISSVVFDYSGHGESTQPGTFQSLREDAVAAYAAFSAQFAGYGRRCVLGFSMGIGPMLESIADFQPTPSCVVVASAFSSLRDAGARRGSPKFVPYMIPDVWDNVEAVSRNRAPLLVVHSDTDAVNPVSMGQQIFDAAHDPKQMVVLHGFRHNAP